MRDDKSDLLDKCAARSSSDTAGVGVAAEWRRSCTREQTRLDITPDRNGHMRMLLRPFGAMHMPRIDVAIMRHCICTLVHTHTLTLDAHYMLRERARSGERFPCKHHIRIWCEVLWEFVGDGGRSISRILHAYYSVGAFSNERRLEGNGTRRQLLDSSHLWSWLCYNYVIQRLFEDFLPGNELIIILFYYGQ